MPGRILDLKKPVRLSLEGEAVTAEEGEPVAAALLASGTLSFARSPKFHRPRGPACMRGACDGCLARVDGVPNVMTCMVSAREGTRVEVQNTLGSREVDFLRVTDWFFPEGMNHHELFAGVPGVQRVMQAFARRVAGLGKLPASAVAARQARRREADVVVVGGGPAGMAVASLLSERGRRVEVFDDGLELGGSLRALSPGEAQGWSDIEQRFVRARAKAGGLSARIATTVGGVYGDDLLVVGPEGAEVVMARAVILATGAHDGVLGFEGNDVPGVMSARAAGMLLRGGVLVGARVVVTVADGGGPFGESFARSVASRAEVTLVRGEPVSVSGSSAVRSVTVREGKRDRKMRADALLVDAPRAPAYELCEQAGAALAHEPRGFIAQTNKGKIRDGFFAVGEVVGTPFDPAAIAKAAEALAAQL
jgi:sarcosine oxidase subunit alpha